jgi:hypothetical protein
MSGCIHVVDDLPQNSHLLEAVLELEQGANGEPAHLAVALS